MSILENILIGIGLSMDAFIIAFSKGYHWKRKECFILSIFFGVFQSFMTILGYLFGSLFILTDFPYKNILMFVIMIYIGIKMMKQTTDKKETFKVMIVILLSILTSLDAYSVGISISLFSNEILIISSIIGIITFFLSIIGSYLGKTLGNYSIKYLNKIGGIIIILYAIKILCIR